MNQHSTTTPAVRYAPLEKLITARDTAAALQSRRKERDAWRAAVQDLRKELVTSAEENARRLQRDRKSVV